MGRWGIVKDAFIVGCAATFVIVGAFAIGNMLARDDNNPPPSEHRCHSLSEDSTPYDCIYDGDTDEWQPK
jgi:hypothetical protein